MALFLRTRAGPSWRIIAPRYAVNAGALAGALAVGAATAWTATALLIGPLPAGRVAVGVLAGSLYPAFAVAVVTMAAGVTGSLLGSFLGGVLVLLAFPAMGLVPSLEPWLPSRLAGAPNAIVKGVGVEAFAAPAISAVALSVVSCAVGARSAGRREL